MIHFVLGRRDFYRVVLIVGVLIGVSLPIHPGDAQSTPAKMVGQGMPQTYGNVTTHVTNNVSGRPADGMTIELFDISGEKPRKLSQASVNPDGRATMVTSQPLPIGRYELRFAVADYFRKEGVAVGDPAFLDFVPIRFSIAEPEAHYHVPLLCSPWGYSTYRGS